MDLEAALVDEFAREHGVHTMVLYGSRARGDATAESDVDVAGFADVASTTRDARPWHGVYLDGFIYPTAQTASLELDMLKLLGGRVLLDERGLAGPMLERLTALDRQGPPPLPAHEAQMRRVWFRKTLARIQRGDAEAHYRFHWLLYNLLEDHFALRGVWYRGPKLALAHLRAHEPETFAAFARALAPGADHAAVEALVELVIA
jgi:Nucleotidyltransferase domain